MAAKAPFGSFVFLRVLCGFASLSVQLLWRRVEASFVEERHRGRAVRAPDVAGYPRQRLVERTCSPGSGFHRCRIEWLHVRSRRVGELLERCGAESVFNC